MSEDEVWKPVRGWEDLYEVSDHGRVRSLDREVANPVGGGTRIYKGRILKGGLAGRSINYRYVQMRCSEEGRTENRYIHRMVLESFVGPPPFPGAQGCHGPDPDPENNRVENLRWGSREENLAERDERLRERPKATDIGDVLAMLNGKAQEDPPF